MKIWLVALACAGVFVVALANIAGAHEFWINDGQYKGPDGIGCCGPNDCFAIEPDDVAVTPSGYVLKTYKNERVPFSEGTPSEDKKYWRCQKPDGSRRCFFAPIGGS